MHIIRIPKQFFFIGFFIFLPVAASANALPDADRDGVPDRDEIEIYRTDPNKYDTDGDGFSDREELVKGFSPLHSGSVKLEDVDTDQDGLSDRMELNFHTDLKNPDTDGDGFLDGSEVAGAFDPMSATTTKLTKRIEINIAKQELSNFLGDVRLTSYPVSSGAYNTTRRGVYTIGYKSPKAWSSYGLWMPWWMNLSGTRMGIHELPYWPSGYREGENHLGKPVSHGCVRLGIGPAEKLYNWTEAGTKVVIY